MNENESVAEERVQGGGGRLKGLVSPLPHPPRKDPFFNSRVQLKKKIRPPLTHGVPPDPVRVIYLLFDPLRP